MANYQLTPEASSLINDVVKKYKYRILSTADSFKDSGQISADDIKCAVEFIEQRRLYQRNHLKQQRKRKLYLYVCILCLVYTILLLMLLFYNKYVDYSGHKDSLLVLIGSVVACLSIMMITVITFYKRFSIHGEQKWLIEQFMLLWNTTEIEIRLFVGKEDDGSDYSFSAMCSLLPNELKAQFNNALEIRNRIIHGKSLTMFSKKEILNGIEELKRVSETLKALREQKETNVSL